VEITWRYWRFNITTLVVLAISSTIIMVVPHQIQKFGLFRVDVSEGSGSPSKNQDSRW
jgi:hypothetical protein